MKIALISEKINNSGGIERYVLNLGQNLAKNNDIYLVAREIENIEFKAKKIIVNYPNITKGLNALFFPYFSSSSIKNEKFDIIHSQGRATYTGNIITFHSCHLAALNAAYKERGILYFLFKQIQPFNKISLYNERMACKEYKNIIAVSKGLKKEIIQYYKVDSEKITVIPNGVDISRFNLQNKEKEKEKIRKKYNLEKNDIVLIIIANEFIRKGVNYIIDSLHYIKDKNIKLLVIGKDNPNYLIKKAKEKDVEDRVIFTGKIEGNEIPNFLMASDIFVFPTYYEAFSLATLEAAAAGLPILMTRVNGSDEILVENKNGYLIERNATNIAEKIESIIYDEKKMREMSKKSRQIAEQYSWDKISKLTYEKYKEILENSKGIISD